MLDIHFEFAAEKSNDEFNLRPEINSRRIAVNIKRFFAEAIAAKGERAVGLVINSESPHALGAIQRRFAPLPNGGEQNFGVGLRPENGAAVFQLFAKFDVVIKFAVINHPARGDAERLVGAGVQINNAQPR